VSAGEGTFLPAVSNRRRSTGIASRSLQILCALKGEEEGQLDTQYQEKPRLGAAGWQAPKALY